MTTPATTPGPADRRTFLKTLGLGAAAALTYSAPAEATARVAARAQARPARLGLDVYSVGRLDWTPFEMMDFAKKWNVQMVHFSEIRLLGSLEADNLRRIRARADELNLDVEIGMRSICPTSTLFDATAGTAEAQLGAMIDAAVMMRSPIVRCVLGSRADRVGEGGINRHIDETVKVLRNTRAKAMDAGIKIAVENHGGDMQSRELKRLIEEAGPDVVGACTDSGYAVWTIEDPHLTLENLAPYVLTSHVRDSAVWMTPEGIASRWTRMGEGNVGIDTYVRNYVERAPARPSHSR